MSEIYDLVVVGGGIAGLAIAEIFARSGLKVIIVEKNSKLCMEASGIHHEWFHFGSLYSIFPTNQLLRTLVGCIDDILVYYRDFDGMNLRVTANGKLVTINKENRWIRDDTLEYIVNKTNDPDFKLTEFESLKELYYKIFMKLSWNKAIKQFIARHNRFYRYDWRKGCASVYIPKRGWLDYSDDMIESFQNNEIDLDPKTHFRIKSYDRPMNAYNIIADLTRSLLSYGGQILLDTEFGGYNTAKDTTEVLLVNNEILKTRKLVLALGKNLRKHVERKIKVTTVASPLLVVYPHVCTTNMVRLTPFMNKTVNHLRHIINGKVYSLIGGGYFANPDDAKEMDSVKDALVSRAKAVFPRMKNAEIAEVYFGYKTEMSPSYSKRNYLYHIKEIDRNIYVVVPGKFSLAFSVAVNAFKELLGHYPNTYVTYDRGLDVSKYIGFTKHRRIVDEAIIHPVVAEGAHL